MFCINLHKSKFYIKEDTGGEKMKEGCNDTNDCLCLAVKCEVHGRCCVCIEKHRKAKNLPYCLRQIEEERIAHLRESEN